MRHGKFATNNGRNRKKITNKKKRNCPSEIFNFIQQDQNLMLFKHFWFHFLKKAKNCENIPEINVVNSLLINIIVYL